MNPILFYLLLALPAIPNLWGIHHAFRHTFATPQERLLWICACVFLPLLGGLAYFFMGRRRVTGRWG